MCTYTEECVFKRTCMSMSIHTLSLRGKAAYGFSAIYINVLFS